MGVCFLIEELLPFRLRFVITRTLIAIVDFFCYKAPHLAGSAAFCYLPSHWGSMAAIALEIDCPAPIQTIDKEGETARQHFRAVRRIEKDHVETLTGAGEKL